MSMTCKCVFEGNKHRLLVTIVWIDAYYSVSGWIEDNQVARSNSGNVKTSVEYIVQKHGTCSRNWEKLVQARRAAYSTKMVHNEAKVVFARVIRQKIASGITLRTISSLRSAVELTNKLWICCLRGLVLRRTARTTSPDNWGLVRLVEDSRM